MVRRNVEDRQHLIQHFPMLRGNANTGVELGDVLLEVADHGAKLYSLWPSPKNEKNFMSQLLA